ncbi:uncharacterized protein LOC135488889 isoform X1 [Lineus longissimus]|uniref:uncharacterized protein LOC135488889 isoform X1 n=1 Tax=Lineus longissimus TaxID=88925 RepID=UPI00315DBB77
MQSSNDHEKPDQDLKGEDKISWVEVKKFVEEKKIEQAECIFLRKPNSEVEIPSKERKNEDEKERKTETEDDDDYDMQTGQINTMLWGQINFGSPSQNPAQFATDRLNDAAESLQKIMADLKEQLRRRDGEEANEIEPKHGELPCCRIRTDLYFPGPFHTPRLNYQQSERSLHED